MAAPDPTQRLLQAILASPDDDAARQVYADALQQRSPGGQGELIAVQVALSALDDEDSYEEDPRRAALEERESALLRQYGPELIAATRLDPIEHFEFTRGFLRSVKTEGPTFVNAARALLATTPLREVTLTKLSGAECRLLAGLPSLGTIDKLTIWGSSRTAIKVTGSKLLAASPGLANLRALTLSMHKIGNAGALAVLASPQLARVTELDLAWNGLDGGGVAALAGHPSIARLRKLRLGYEPIGLEAARALAASPHLGALEELALPSSGLDGAGVRQILGSRQLTSLTTLGLESTAFGADEVGALAGAVFAPRLAELRLSSARGGDGLATALAGSGAFPSLARLTLSTCGLTGAGLRALLESRSLTALRHLDVGNHDLGGDLGAIVERLDFARLRSLGAWGARLRSDGLARLGRSPQASQLRQLQIGSNYFGPSAGEALAEATQLGRLSSLMLYHATLGADGARALCRATGLRRLRHLKLNNNELGDAGARALMETDAFPALLTLDLSANELSHSMKKDLRRRFGAIVTV